MKVLLADAVSQVWSVLTLKLTTVPACALVTLTVWLEVVFVVKVRLLGFSVRAPVPPLLPLTSTAIGIVTEPLVVVEPLAVTVTAPVFKPFGRPDPSTWIVHVAGVVGEEHVTVAHDTLEDGETPMLEPPLAKIE
jgi:hypothetical protein